MKLYHFCAAHMVASILKNGLTLGQCTIFYPMGEKLIPKCQWLTSESDPEKQSWATARLIQYSRTAYRLTIEIPYQAQRKLHRAADFIMQYPLEARGLVIGWEGSENWYIFKGIVPPEWIAACCQMPQEVEH